MDRNAPLPRYDFPRRQFRCRPRIIVAAVATRRIAELMLCMAVLALQLTMCLVELKAGHGVAEILRLPALMAGIAG